MCRLIQRRLVLIVFGWFLMSFVMLGENNGKRVCGKVRSHSMESGNRTYFHALVFVLLLPLLHLGFLNGLPGFRWHFYQALWYRCLVDREISKLKACK